MSIAFSPSAVLTIDSTLSFLQAGGAEPIEPPWVQPGASADLDFVNGRYWSASLGTISAASAFTEARTTSTWVQQSNGLLVTAAAAVPAIASGTGLWSQTTDTCRMDFNNDLSNAAWVKTNITATQDYPSAFAVGTPAGWRITATAANATILQTTTPLALGSVTDNLPHAMFYWDGTPLNGAIEITQYASTGAWTDVRPYLVSGKWVQIPGAVEPITGANNVSGVRIAANGDSIGFCLLNVSRATTMPGPILTTGTGNVTRDSDFTTLNTANFPTIYDKTKFTVIIVSRPNALPLPPAGQRPGWTGFEINNAYTITATGTGETTANGLGLGSTMNVHASPAPTGTFALGNTMVVETGIGSFQNITAMSPTSPYTGTGGAGTYRLDSTAYPSGQTSAPNIAMRARLPDAIGFGLNAVEKAITLRLNIGVTFTVQASLQNAGYDPQTAEYAYNEPNAMGWSVDMTNTSAISAVVALKGDTELVEPADAIVAPVLNSSVIINFGCGYPGIGPYLNGYTLRCIIFAGVALSQAEMAAITSQYQAFYAGQ